MWISHIRSIHFSHTFRVLALLESTTLRLPTNAQWKRYLYFSIGLFAGKEDRIAASLIYCWVRCHSRARLVALSVVYKLVRIERRGPRHLVRMYVTNGRVLLCGELRAPCSVRNNNIKSACISLLMSSRRGDASGVNIMEQRTPQNLLVRRNQHHADGARPIGFGLDGWKIPCIIP